MRLLIMSDTHVPARAADLVARVGIEGLRLAVVHETGPAKGREERCARVFPTPTC